MARGKPFKGLKKKPKKQASGISDKLTRLLEIYMLIARNRYPSVEYLKERYNVSERSVFRYIQAINMIDEAVYDKEKAGYYFKNSNRLKKIALTQKQLMLLLALGETAAHLGSPLKKEFAEFTDAVTNIAGTPAPDRQSILVKIPDAIDPGSLEDYFRDISVCINERRSIDIEYDSKSSGKAKRRVNPYGVVFYNGAWFLIGFCQYADEIRHFRLDRIAELRMTNRTFRLPEDFDLNAHTAKSWGIWHGAEVEVIVRFSPTAAGYITAKPKWHASEKREVLPSGEVELTFKVMGVDEIKRWIYTWIPHVKILKPVSLREEVKKEMAEMIGQQ